MGFHQLSKFFEERMLHAMQHRVEDRLAREQVRTGAGERVETNQSVGASPRANAVRQQRYLQVVTKSIQRCLVDADGGLDSAKENVFDLSLLEGVTNAIVGQR